MVRYNNNKLGEIIDSKVVNLANNNVIKLHQRARLNAVIDSKLKSLEKDTKEKSINEVKESSYRESKAPKIEEANFVVIDEEEKKISSKEAIEKIEIKNLEKNEPTNKEKIISYYGNDIIKFDHLHEAVQFTPKILSLALAKKFGINKDINVMYLPSNDNEHYGRADGMYFNNNNYYTEQYKFLCYKNNKLNYPLTSEKIWYMNLINELSNRI